MGKSSMLQMAIDKCCSIAVHQRLTLAVFEFAQLVLPVLVCCLAFLKM
jgi:hypothetical protein